MRPARAREGSAAAELPGLTGVRFIAAFWVVCYHAMPRGDLPAPVAAVVTGGYSGVSLFFVLSGFILAHVYGDAAAPGHRFPTRPFLVARFARIYPAYLAALLFALPALIREVLVNPDAPTGFRLGGVCLSTVSMLQAWVPGWGCWWNCPGWSLSVEAFFYVAFPFLAPRLLRMSAGSLAGVGMAAWLAALALAPFTTVDVAGEGTWLGRDLQLPGVTAWTPLVRLPEFIIGICASRALRTTASAPRIGWFAGCVAGLSVVGAAALPPSNTRFMLLWPGLSLAYALLIAALASPLHRSLLSSRVFQRLGNASYSLYLIHAVAHGYVLAVINRTWGREHAGGWVVFLLYVSIALVMSLVLHDVVEVPARRRLRSVLA